MRNFLNKFKAPLIFCLIAFIATIITISIPKINDSISKLTDSVVDNVNNEEEAKELKVHYFNVGQGDSEFIELPNGKTILIDAGEREQGQNVVKKITDLGYEKIDYVIATHPHSDHIGGLIDVFDAFDVKSVYMPNCVHTTKTYEDFIASVENEGCKVVKAFNGVKMINSDGIDAYFVAPNSENYEKINNYSACLMLKYGDSSFLFMGDAEQESEYEIPGDLTCDVIKVGHHGSDTSSSYNFVNRTHAKYAVIECGLDNDYGHPHDKTINTWKENGTIIFRTDLNGDILFVSNGKIITYQNEVAYKDKDDVKKNNNVVETTTQQETDNSQNGMNLEHKYVLNTESKKIHYPSCKSVKDMSPKNKRLTNKSIAELEKEGYTPCGSCRPSE